MSEAGESESPPSQALVPRRRSLAPMLSTRDMLPQKSTSHAIIHTSSQILTRFTLLAGIPIGLLVMFTGGGVAALFVTLISLMIMIALPLTLISVMLQWFYTRKIEHDHASERFTCRHFKKIRIDHPDHNLQSRIRLAISQSGKSIRFIKQPDADTIRAHVRLGMLEAKIDIGVRILSSDALHAELFIWSTPVKSNTIYDGGRSRALLNALLDRLEARPDPCAPRSLP